jgi:hypothetical protein
MGARLEMTNLITEHIDVWTAAQAPKVNVGRGRSEQRQRARPTTA